MVAEEIVITLSGGAPWGFRLQGGAEQQEPLQVAKVRRRSKACRAGLREYDELVAIGHRSCADLSHADAMSLIDTESATLSLRVRRAPPGFLSSPHSAPSAAPLPSRCAAIISPAAIPSGITSPPDSEAYYGETDSDADTQALTHRRQRRTPPHARSPARYDNQDEEETSEMSGYESATDAGLSLQGQWEGVFPHREPLQTKWTSAEHTPNPHTLTPTPRDQALAEAEGEGDSGFQEAGVCTGLACPPLVSPERAKEALMMGSSQQLVPMVGPQHSPVNDDLSTTYMDKARQAKLQRGESLVEKQVKEARTKCRSIASLLTDAPNPNSKGVLMFKKRRQRAKKYTLTCFGKAEGDRGGDSEGETGGETEEEGGSSIQSGSEVDEAGFSASFDPTWDAGYLDLLEKRSSACPSAAPTAPATPTANNSSRLDAPAYQWAGPATFDHQSPGSEVSALERSANQSSSLENCSTKQPIHNHMPPPAAPLANGGSVAVSRASVVLSAPSRMPLSSQTGRHGSPNPSPKPSLAPDPESLNASFSPNHNVLNRTARPFTPGAAPSRPTVTSVMFRPPQPKPAVAVSMVTLQPTHHASDAKRAVSSASLYIPSRNNSSSSSPPPSANAPPSAFPQPASLPFAPFPHPPLHPPQPAASPSTPFPPRAPQSTVFPSPSQPFSPPPPQPLSSHPAPPPPTSASPLSPPHASDASLHMQPFPAPPPPTHPSSPSVHPYVTPTGAVPSCPHAAMATASPPQPAADAVAAREHRIAVPAARTGILSDARRRSNKKPMFSAVQIQDVSPNPDLMSMVQNMDGHVGGAPASEPGAAPCGETGHESGPEEDWLRLGAEACNFMQAQRGPRPPPVAPKPQSPQAPPLAGKGGQLFARRQNRMDRYVVERAPSAAAAPYSPAHTRGPSPTPSLPATWKYSSNIRAPPPISYNPLLSPSCPPQAQKKPQAAGPKVQKPTRSVEVMSRQPYQLNSSLFSYAGGAPQNAPPHQRGTGGGPQKTARVCEIRRFSTPPPASTGPALQVLAPRSATSLGERLSGSGATAPPATAFPAPRPQPLQAHWASSPLSPPAPPAPTAALPQLPSFSSPAPDPAQPPSFAPLQGSCSVQTSKPFKSAPDLSPQRPGSSPGIRVPRPRFSTSNLGLQPSVWRPGSTLLSTDC